MVEPHSLGRQLVVSLETAKDGPLTGLILCFNALRKKKKYKDNKCRVYYRRQVLVSLYILLYFFDRHAITQTAWFHL